MNPIETAVSNAAQDAIDIALKWGAAVNREDRAAGGLHWCKYDTSISVAQSTNE